MIKETEIELAKIHRQLKKLNLQKLRLITANADPEKSKRLFQISSKLYLQVLESDVTDDLNLKSFLEHVIECLDSEELQFFKEHKHNQFRQGKKLFDQYYEHQSHKTLRKESYISILGIKKPQTLNQLIKYIAGAKVQRHRDVLIQELKALKEKENLRYTLFEQEGYNQITDYNERECLLMIKTNPEQTDKVMMEKLKIPKSNWNRYKRKFKAKGLVE